MVQQYVQNYAQAFCQQLLQCCDGYDAGGIDIAACVAQQLPAAGFEETLPGNTAAYAAGHLILNSSAASDCLTALPTLSCATVTASANGTIANRCFGVFSGTIALDAGGCTSSFECSSGYCNLPGDGGLGTCNAILATGDPCQTQDMCSQAQVRPTAYCTSQLAADGGGGTCQPLLSNGQACIDRFFNFVDMSCAAELCGDQSVCGGSYVNGSTGTSGACSAFPVDAGGG